MYIFFHKSNYNPHITLHHMVDILILGWIVVNTERYCIVLYCIGIVPILSRIALVLVLLRKSVNRPGLAPTYSMIVSVWHKLNHYNSWNNKDTLNLNITYESLCFGIYRYLNKKLQNGCFLPLHMLLIAWVYQ